MTGTPLRGVYVETGVQLGGDDGAAAWCFDLDLGVCTQGADADEVLERFRAVVKPVRVGDVRVAEIVTGDEQAFGPDLAAPSPDQVAVTRRILRKQRARSLGLLRSTPTELLDRDDPERRLPGWASWRTIRQTLWHVADTESRYYLPSLGLPARERAPDLERELVDSAAHVATFLDAVADRPDRWPDRRSERGEVWTAVKVLRRLAWHERGELDAVDALLARWRAG